MLQAAKCPSCGGSIQIPDDKDLAHCMYCGTQIIVSEALSRSIDRKATIKRFMGLAHSALEGNDFQEADGYYSRALEMDDQNYLAWFGKAVTTLHLSPLDEPRYSQFMKLFTKARELAAPASADFLKRKSVEALNSFAYRLLKRSLDEIAEPQRTSRRWTSHQRRCLELYDVMDSCLEVEPRNQTTHQAIIAVSEAILHGCIMLDDSGRTSRVYPERKVMKLARDRMKTSSEVLRPQK